MKNNELTIDNMINELNSYEYDINNLFEIVNMFYEVEETEKSVNELFDILKSNKVNYELFGSMVNEYYLEN